MPEIKMIVMDLDGTLLRSDKTVDTLTKKYLWKAQRKGIILVLATGRDKSGIEFVSDPLRLEEGNNYIAGVNGQIIYGFSNKEYYVDHVLSGSDANKIMRVAQKYGCETICCCGYDNYALSNWKIEWMKKVRKFLFGAPMDYGLAQGKRNFIPIDSVEYTIHQDVNKCIYVQSKRFFKRNLAKMREELTEYDVLEVGPMWIEIMPKGVNKGSAVLKIAEENGISKEEIICFGDAENDLSMFRAIPHGIAMGNAMQVVKDAAYAVTDTNENAGIAKALKRYVFHEE